MILLDVIILVNAFRREAPDHDRYAAWLTEAARGPEELALHDATVTGFVRIVTNPRIVRPPAPGSAAVAFIDRLVAAPRTVGCRAARTATADRGFAHFPGLDWFDPLIPEQAQRRTR